MTDRIHSYSVILDRDLREDDAKSITNAIRMIKGVLKVTHHVSDHNFHAAQARARAETRDRLYKMIEELE